MAADVALVGDPVEVLENGLAIGDALLVLPGFEDEAKRMHVAVGSYARIAEQIPGSPEIFPPFQQGEAAARAHRLQMRSHADPGKARTYDRNIDIG